MDDADKPRPPAASAREKALAEALRKNLRRRKTGGGGKPRDPAPPRD